jgi:hypothetical protein
MPTSTAISAQGSVLSIAGMPGSAITITGITKATSAVVTGTNTLNVGDVVLFGTVTNMPEISGLFGVVTVASGTTFTVSIDSSSFASAGTTGTATPQTFIKINNFHDYTGFDGSATELDRTNLSSLAMENFPGLQDFGQFSFNLDVDNSDAGQLALRANKTTSTIGPYKLVLPNGKVRVWNGWVKKFSETGGVNAILKAAVDVRITGTVTFG